MKTLKAVKFKNMIITVFKEDGISVFSGKKIKSAKSTITAQEIVDSAR